MSLKLKPLDEQVIVITGASSGIGLETAKLAAEGGAKVVIASRNASELFKIAEQIRKKDGSVHAVPTDVRNFEEVERLANEAVKIYGRVDTWVNNAGHSLFGNLMDSDLEEEKEIFETNFWGVRHGCRVAIPLLAKNGGALINLGSEVSGISVPIQGIYSATKHAVKAYTDALRVELHHKGYPISVTLIRPAAINTPFAKHAANRLEKGAPSLPAPVYDVENVARAILKCAESPQRDAYIGSVSKIYDLVGTLFPKFSDRMLEKMMDQQAQGKVTEHPRENESIHHPPAQEGAARAPQEAKVRSKSYYTQVMTGQKKTEPPEQRSH